MRYKANHNSIAPLINAYYLPKLKRVPLRYLVCVLGFTALIVSCSQRPPLPSFNEWRARHITEVTQLEAHLIEHDITHVLPLNQILRTASDWHDCAQEPYAVPPQRQWDSLVRVLRLVGALRVAGILGEVEVHSGYRNAYLNNCAGGAARSAHLRSFALDISPLNDADLTEKLCAFWRAEGKNWDMGLSRYPSGRIHLDTAGFRSWGTDEKGKPTSCRILPDQKSRLTAHIKTYNKTQK
jgi:hypothetical protein